MRIAFIIAFHGPWHEIFNRVFLPSAARNADVADFYIFSSQDSVVPHASNVYIENIGNLKERSFLYSERLGFKVDIKNGYKLNDFRPFDYTIFNNKLRQDKNYTHWGWIDTDMLLGSFSQTLLKMPMATVITVPPMGFDRWTPPSMSGGLTIVEIRTPPIELIPPNRTALSHSENYAFDERTKFNEEWLKGENITFASYKTLRVNRGLDLVDRQFSWPSWSIDKTGHITRAVYDDQYLRYNTWWPGGRIIEVDITWVAFVHFEYAKRLPVHIADPARWEVVQFSKNHELWIGPREPTMYDGMPNGLDIVIDRL
jgi:hypothetical protein